MVVPNRVPNRNNPLTWNTQNLSLRIAGDAVAATASGGLVAPLITIIDRSIIENASGRRSMAQSLRDNLVKMMFRPDRFFLSKPFALVFMLYGATYMSANALDTAMSTISASKPPATPDDVDPRSPIATTAGTPKFLFTSATNLTLCVYKDSRFAKYFGTTTPRSVPSTTLLLFACRDACTVFASFNLPILIAPKTALLPGWNKDWEKHTSRISAAQFVAPAAIQAFSTPLHLLGLDLYNRPNVPDTPISSRDRLSRVARDYGKSFAARICRILPAFGVGGVVNTRVRRWYMARLPR